MRYFSWLNFLNFKIGPDADPKSPLFRRNQLAATSLHDAAFYSDNYWHWRYKVKINSINIWPWLAVFKKTGLLQGCLLKTGKGTGFPVLSSKSRQFIRQAFLQDCFLDRKEEKGYKTGKRTSDRFSNRTGGITVMSKNLSEVMLPVL